MESLPDATAEAYGEIFWGKTIAIGLLDASENLGLRRISAQLRDMREAIELNGVLFSPAPNTHEGLLQCARRMARGYVPKESTDVGLRTASMIRGIEEWERARVILVTGLPMEAAMQEGSRFLPASQILNRSKSILRRICPNVRDRLRSAACGATLETVGSITVTEPEKLSEEILSPGSTGVTVFDEDHLSLSTVHGPGYGLMDAAIQAQQRAGKFRPRSGAEIAALRNAHETVHSGTMIVGGASLVSSDGGWHELCALWRHPHAKGMGARIVRLVSESGMQRGMEQLFALTSEQSAGLALTQNGFQAIGRVSGLRHDQGREDVPPFVHRYSVEGRDPDVYVRRATR